MVSDGKQFYRLIPGEQMGKQGQINESPTVIVGVKIFINNPNIVQHCKGL